MDGGTLGNHVSICWRVIDRRGSGMVARVSRRLLRFCGVRLVGFPVMGPLLTPRLVGVSGGWAGLILREEPPSLGEIGCRVRKK